jgi:hypothetical protein
VSSEIKAATSLAAKIKGRELNALFSCREVYLKGWTGLNSPDKAKSAIEILCDAGWIRKYVRTGTATAIGGRPSDEYEVSPKIWSL